MVLICDSSRASEDDTFHVIDHMYFLFGQQSASFIVHSLIGLFVSLLLGSSSYVLDINHLSDGLTKMFSRSLVCLFTPLTVTFSVRKLLNFSQSHLSNVGLIS